MRQFRSEQMQFNARQEQFNGEMRQFRSEQMQFNTRFERRLDRMNDDLGMMKGYFARTALSENAKGITEDMGLTFVRALPRDEVWALARQAANSGIPVNDLRSFREADLIIEATGDSGLLYVAMECSYTADLRDTNRARRNAGFLTQFTGRPARAAIASVRNDHAVDELIESGAVYWHTLPDRIPFVE